MIKTMILEGVVMTMAVYNNDDIDNDDNLR